MPPGTGSIKGDVNMTVNQDATKADVSGSMSPSPSFEANFSVNGGASQNLPLQNEPSSTLGFVFGLLNPLQNKINFEIDLPPSVKENPK
jgi:hypothetical protein